MNNIIFLIASVILLAHFENIDTGYFYFNYFLLILVFNELCEICTTKVFCSDLSLYRFYIDI